MNEVVDHVRLALCLVSVKLTSNQLTLLVQFATSLEKQLRNKEKELGAFQEKYKIRMKVMGVYAVAEAPAQICCILLGHMK